MTILKLKNRKEIMNNFYICLISSFIFATTYAQTSPKQEIEKLRNRITETGKDINWEEFDTTSKVLIDKIQIELLQGEWKAYNGLFKFGGSVNSMALTTPLTIEFKENKYRRSKDSKFEKFDLTNNQIVSKKENYFGVINKITDNLIVITWKNGDNYTRYYYEK